MTEYYDLISDILKCLWINDDILFEEDYDVANRKAKELATALDNPDAVELADILKRAVDSVLEQEDLFDAQDKAEELAKEYAEKEHRWRDFNQDFPWLS